TRAAPPTSTTGWSSTVPTRATTSTGPRSANATTPTSSDATTRCQTGTRSDGMSAVAQSTGNAAERRPAAAQSLEPPGVYLSGSHLRGLGLQRRAIDAVFRAVPNVIIPGYSKPVIGVEDFLRHMDGWTYRDDRVYPSR